ncbi:MAG: hypothetical protein ACRDTR_02105 [Rubrobacter sp.]
MVKVSIRVRSGAARFGVAVWAESLEQAVSLAGERYPNSDVMVRSPIYTSDDSPGDRDARTRIEASRRTHEMAA